MQTAFELVRRAAQRTPGHAAVVDDTTGRRLTYAELIAEIEAIAAGLHTRGIGPGQMVATVLPNVFEHCLVLLALERIGAVPALVSPRLKPEAVATLISDAGMSAAIAVNHADLVTSIATVLPEGAPLLTVGGESGGSEDFACCRLAPASLGPEPAPEPDETAFVFYTSGTTGLPKAVMIPHRASEPRLIFVSTQGGLTQGTDMRTLGLMPLSHVIGFYSVYLFTLAMNGTYYVAPVFDPEKTVDAIEAHAITFLFASPTHFHAIVSAPGFAASRVASVRNLLYGGAPMAGPLQDRVDEAFEARIVNIYGTTETMNTLYMPDAVGRPLSYRPGFYSNIRLVKIGGGIDETVAPGEEGELLAEATADATFTGYLNRPDATAEKLHNGWYRTGDVFVEREDGDLELRGRADDMIVTGGENVHAGEIEAVLASHPAIADVAVVGITDERWGERVVACVVAEAEAPSEADLDAHCKASTLANFKRPRGYVFIDALPRNAANKVLRQELRNDAEATLAPPG